MSVMHSRARHLITAALLLFASVLSGCAHQNMRDPLEPLNRGIYTFNDAVDRAVLKPVATGYRTVLPQFVRTGVANFFSNLNDITVIINNVLQLKITQAASDAGRLLINTTLGVLGLFDVATQLGLEKHNEDFGQTLGYWGVASGPYLVLPFLGPSSFRDGLGRLVDWHTDVIMNIEHMRTRNQFWGTRVISDREHLLDSEKVLDTAAIDRYAFLRDAYLQRRRSLVYDGNPPTEPEDEDLNGKPQSQLQEPPFVSVLVDQYGAIVAGPAEQLQQTGREPAPRTAAPERANPSTAKTPASKADSAHPGPLSASASTPASASPADTAPINGAHPAPGPVVRVWLPGSSSQ